MEEEIWKDIPGYNGYQASNMGRIRSHNKMTYTKKHGIRCWEDRILKFKPSTTTGQRSKQGMGYRVDLWKDGKPKTLLVSRLVATTFLENLINTDMTVNHKDGNRLNNNVNNLEWVSRADNIKYGFENGQYKQQSITLYNEKEQHYFRSLSLASQFIGRSRAYISNNVKKNKKIVSSTGIQYNYELK